jgi:sporulation protein YlmC with PRC-barrel domain
MATPNRGGGSVPGATRHPRARFTIVAKKSVLGVQVFNAQGEDIGTIEDLVIDTWGNRVAYAILSFGNLPGMAPKNFAIPWEALRFDLAEKVAFLNIHKDRLENAPGFDKNNWPDMTDPCWGMKLCDAYGYEPRRDFAANEREPVFYRPPKSNFACWGIFLPSDSAGIESEAVIRR